jgi:integrase/recombinase XerD
MLGQILDSYLKVRRACGFKLGCQGKLLQSFADFSNSRGKHYVCSDVAIEWAGLSRSLPQRARRLSEVIRFSRYIRAEDSVHEIPPPVFGIEKRLRPIPYIFSQNEIQRILQAASELGHHPFRGKTYSALFALLACTGMRVSEATALRFKDITLDGLIIKRTKFRKNRLVPLHETAMAGIKRYFEQRSLYAPYNDHVFVSLKEKPLQPWDTHKAFKTVVNKIGFKQKPNLPRPTLHSFRHTFAVRALENCTGSRDHITKHMLALSTYLGHSKIYHTYWYLEAVPDLMGDIAQRCENFFKGGGNP